MSRPDNLVPHDYDTKPRGSGRKRGNALMLWLTLILLAFTLVTVVVIVTVRPEVIGLGLIYDLTQTQVGFQGTADSLKSLGGSLNQTAVAQAAAAATNAQQAFNNEVTLAANNSTLAALDNRQNALNAASTQIILDVNASQTSVAIANAQQATRGAIDFQSTQNAFIQEATRSQLQFQGTQAALNQNATSIALGFITATPPPIDFLSATPPPPALFDERFSEGLGGGFWTFSGVEDWGLNDEGVLAAQGITNWLLTQQSDFTEYIFDARLVVLQGAGLISANYILLNIPADETVEGLALELYYDGQQLRAVGLYRVTRAQILSETYLASQGLNAIQAVQIENSTPAAETNIRVEVRNARVVAAVNGEIVLNVMLDSVPPPGSIGLYVPVGTQVRQVTILP